MDPRIMDRLKILPSGTDFFQLKELGFEHPQKTNKENIIITVGRIGSEQKNNEMSLEALNGLDLKEWKFVFIGPIEKDFLPCTKNLPNNIIFTGNIADRTEIYNWYKKAKVFCLTSKWESWCLAMADSLYFGCEIISTNVGCFEDITNKEFGYEIKNANDLRNILQKIINKEIDPLENFEKIIKQRDKYDWHSVCGELDKMLQECKS
jgi:glycosyltransferase involved in cell wall biosynthesis